MAFPNPFALGRKTLMAFKSTLGPSPEAGCGARAVPHPQPQPLPRGFARRLQRRDLQTVRVFAGGYVAVS